MNKNPVIMDKDNTIGELRYLSRENKNGTFPVVDNRLIIGTVSRQEVIKTLQFASRQPQVADTIDDMLIKRFSYSPKENGLTFYGGITLICLEVWGQPAGMP